MPLENAFLLLCQIFLSLKRVTWTLLNICRLGAMLLHAFSKLFEVTTCFLQSSSRNNGVYSNDNISTLFRMFAPIVYSYDAFTRFKMYCPESHCAPQPSRVPLNFWRFPDMTLRFGEEKRVITVRIMWTQYEQYPNSCVKAVPQKANIDLQATWKLKEYNTVMGGNGGPEDKRVMLR